VTPVATVIGIGLVTPIGASLKQALDARAAGAGVAAGVPAHVTRSGGHVRTAAVPGESAGVSLGPAKLEKYLGWPARLALCAATEALRAAGLMPSDRPAQRTAVPERIGVYVAVGTSGLDCDEFLAACSAAWPGDEPGTYDSLGGRPLRLIDPHFAVRTLANGPAAFVAMQAGARGPSMVFVQSACAGVNALQAAVDDLDTGRCDVAIVAACDSLLAPTPVLVRERSGVLDRTPSSVLSEGAAALVLERPGNDATHAHGVVIGTEVVGLCDGVDVVSSQWASMLDVLHGGEERPRVWCAAVDGATEVLDEGVRTLSLHDAAPTTVRDLGDLGAATALAWTALAIGQPHPGPTVIVVAEPSRQVGAVVVGPPLPGVSRP
jgi:3-oxoacyl-[acyl-carrier-protein] synthase II